MTKYIRARQLHGRQARGAGPRHPRDPCRFLHGRVRVPQDARPVVGAGLGSGRDRPRPGDERHAGIGNPRRAPRQDARHHQTGEGHGRQARPRGTQVRGGGAEPAARGRHHLRAHGQRLVRLHGVRRRRVRPQDRRMGVRHHHGHQGAAAAGAGTGDIMGRLAWRHGRSRAPFRPWRAVHQPRVHRQGRGIRHASLDRHGRRLVRQRHGRERRRRVQDRARLATQALPGFEGPGIGDVPVGLVVELEASAPVLGLQDTGTDRNRVLCKPSGASRPTIRAEQKSGHINESRVLALRQWGMAALYGSGDVSDLTLWPVDFRIGAIWFLLALFWARLLLHFFCETSLYLHLGDCLFPCRLWFVSLCVVAMEHSSGNVRSRVSLSWLSC